MRVREGAPLRRPRRSGSKPPVPANMKSAAAAARERHKKRHTQAGVVVEIEKAEHKSFRLVSPHRDLDTWEAMICDAVGTRSVATGYTFLYNLAALCDQIWHPNEDGNGGERVPDETQLNMILNMVGSIKPRNEMEAALAAQMVAVHMMTMRTAEAALSTTWGTSPQFAATAGKLARTFAILTDTLNKGRGKQRSSKQTITVRQEKHVHHHQHVHMAGGGAENRGQPFEPSDSRNGGNNPGSALVEHESRPALPGQDAPGNGVPMPSEQGEEAVPSPRRGKRIRRAEG
jgi:hypothetical protein